MTCLKHNLVLTNDHRSYFSISSFGYLQGGILEVIVDNLTITPDPADEQQPEFKHGFALIKSNQSRNPFVMDSGQGDLKICLLTNPIYFITSEIITLTLDPASKKVLVRCTSDDTKRLPPLKPLSKYDHHKNVKRAATITQKLDNKSSGDQPELHYNLRRMHECPEDLPLIEKRDEFERRSYSFNFSMSINEEQQEGFYYLTLHKCRQRNPHSPIQETQSSLNLSVQIEEKNFPYNYLSAGVMPLPQIYFILSVMFFLCGCIWMNFINRQRDRTLKIHTLMTVLVFAKSFSLLMHGINYHYIALYGQPVVTWAYIYYATRTIKGALFFITLALIGSGWSFIKHILSDKDKKIIMVIVGLQIIAHIAEIVLDESSEGEASNEFWAELCSLVDLFSCVAILYPIGWSVRHLEEASRTDGKAAINLKKLELFKRFYIISTIYIYMTRIITFVLLSILTFRYSWLAELGSELVTLMYFIVTGCYFQPIPMNPYLLLSSENDQEEDILFSMSSHTTSNNQIEYVNDDSEMSKDVDRLVTRRHVEDIV